MGSTKRIEAKCGPHKLKWPKSVHFSHFSKFAFSLKFCVLLETCKIDFCYLINQKKKNNADRFQRMTFCHHYLENEENLRK